jgi:hypothetical protein
LARRSHIGATSRRNHSQNRKRLVEMNRDGAAFLSEQLTGMHCGTVELSVPLRDDVIQVGARGNLESARIRVSKGPRTIVVVRVDGRPLQADIIITVCRSDEAGTDDEWTTAAVFREPVRALRLTGTRDETGQLWWSAPHTRHTVAHHAHLKQLADTIGTFATAKQLATAQMYIAGSM